MVFYEGTNQHLYEVYWNTSASAWQNADLHVLSGATTLIATNGSIGSVIFSGNGGIYIFFIGTNQHVICINWANAWLTGDVTALSSGVSATTGTALTSFSTAGSTPMMNFYVGPSQHIYATYWSTAGSWQTVDFTAFTGATSVAAASTALSNNPTGPQAYYFGSNQHLNDINWNGSAWVNYDLTSLSGSGVLAAGGSSLSAHGVSAGNTYNLFFEGPDQHIYHAYSVSGSTWSNEDTTATASNQLLDSGIVSLTIPNGTSAFIATACYGESINPFCAGKAVNVTPSDVASALTAVLNGTGSPVNATANGPTINLTWRIADDVTATVPSITSYSDYPSMFAGSFTSTSGNFTGGTVPGSQSTSAPLITLYTYDALGNLTCVEQHGDAATGTGCNASPSSDATSPWRVRRFTYDSLSRLLSSSNPEANTAMVGLTPVRVNTTYSYDLDSNLVQKTSPAPNQTGMATQTISYCFDALNRITGRAYSAQSCPLTTPVVSYTYDIGTNAKGRLTSLVDQGGIATYGYDTLGRVITETRSIAGISKEHSYSYNLDGSIQALTYPSNRVITYKPDSGGTTTPAEDGSGANFVSNASYYANGTEFQRFMPGIYFSTTLNPRLQVSGLYSDNGQISSFFLDRSYNYGAFHQNNGNLISIANNKDPNRSQSFTYDSLNRLTSGASATNTGTSSWGENYSTDAWGNLQISPMSGKAHGGNFQLSGNQQNRPTGLAYDSAGNLMSYNSATYTYDQENRLSSTAGTSYLYDGNGERVLKANATTGAPIKRYWSMGGNTLAEGDSSGNLTAEYIYFGGKRVARIDLPSNNVHYYLSDHLGSTSVIVNAAGIVEEESDYSPFGTESIVIGPGVNELKFTGKRRDTESQLDYFGARYYAAIMGRFMTPDPIGLAAGNLANPQSMNVYSYVLNNPMINIDPDGRECVWDDGSYDSLDDKDTGSPNKCDGQGGTWIGHDVFQNSQYYKGDWSGDADSGLRDLVAQIQGCAAAVGGGQTQRLLIANAFASGFTNEMTAYVLGTAQWESGMGALMTERGGTSYLQQYNGKLGNNRPGDAVTYKGRGYVQITGKSNYQHWSNELGVDLLHNPETAATPDIAAQIAVEGMDKGSFTGTSLYDYVNSSQADYYNARSVINGDKSRNGQPISMLAGGFAMQMSGCR